ncbi:MAG TPA: acetylxylan esterase [Chloroflexota bacterium]|jgi:cephalosporin-C deacetylase
MSGLTPSLDRGEFWARTMAEVMSRPPAPEVDPLPLRSAPFADGYGVKLTCGLGDYRLFAYYSLPKSQGPHPAIYHAPGYASVVQVPPYEERRRHAVLSMCARGQRLSDRPFAASYPGLLTHDVEDPGRYPFRGIVGDTCRGLDFLRLRGEVDRGRVVVVGGDMALFAAIFRPEIRAAVVSDPFFPGLFDLARRTDAYPIEEINDYLRMHPERGDAVGRTLELFDPTHLLDRVRCEVLLSCGPGYFDRAAAEAIGGRIGGAVTIHERTGKGLIDRRHVEAWISERTGQAIGSPYPAETG